MVTLDDLTPVFHQVFDDDSIALERGTTADDVDNWDSLNHMNLIMALELKYRIKFALGEIQNLKNVGEMLDLINAKLAK